MKHLKLILLTMLLLFVGAVEANAYEVYEHNKGDDNHLVSKSKVMGATMARIGDVYIQTNGYGDIEVTLKNSSKLEYSRLCSLDPKWKGSYYFVEPGEITISNPPSSTSASNWIQESLTVYYSPTGVNKLYKVIISTRKGDKIEVEGIPTFYKCDKLGLDLDVIGSEKSVGTEPVFLEWLEHWAKKKKFQLN